jgi:hypothetical protein
MLSMGTMSWVIICVAVLIVAGVIGTKIKDRYY